ncbi:ATP-dependent Clp protease adapter ClpS [Leeia oryzae]|uniref:ATP-dependent Clp protease adapter ClpS n=1 Tax=Leeia oryzae TaxID=356662 RepID=UPI0003800E87|nr:ATP-dependent Clp protease adapter ClpS [Leeia oryzae]
MSSKSKELLQTKDDVTKVTPPPFWKVVLLNDDFTPMDFVVHVLQQFFHLDVDQATRIMLMVHQQGRGICGVYSKDVAETKVQQVRQFAKEHQHPLQCVMEEN